MEEIKNVEKAYKNLDFLNSPSARTIRMLAEFYEPQSRFQKNNIVDTIVFFGSARLVSNEDAEINLKKLEEASASETEIRYAKTLLEMSKYYEDAVELSQRLTEWSNSLENGKRRFTVCSGGGPGIMEAANKGAKQAGGTSIGLNISIPFEQFVNKYVDPELSFEFHYFFMRKFWFVYLAKALIVFPGGFGTMDELMEVLTLIQTEKIKKEMKVIVYDSKYWKSIINFENLIKHGMISEGDIDLFHFSDTVEDAFDTVKNHCEKYYINKKPLE